VAPSARVNLTRCRRGCRSAERQRGFTTACLNLGARVSRNAYGDKFRSAPCFASDPAPGARRARPPSQSTNNSARNRVRGVDAYGRGAAAAPRRRCKSASTAAGSHATGGLIDRSKDESHQTQQARALRSVPRSTPAKPHRASRASNGENCPCRPAARARPRQNPDGCNTAARR